VKRPFSVAWFVLALGTTSAANAGDLRGSLQGLDTLRSTPVPEVPERRLYFWMQSNGALATRDARPNPERDVAVVLSGDNVPESAQPVPVTVAGGTCQPGTVLVNPGTTLNIRNVDWFAHELFLTAPNNETPIEGFAPEATAPNSQRSAQVRTAGTYVIRDRLNPMFRCWVVVGPGQGRHISPAADGTFRTSNVADGEYTLKVFFEGRVVATSTARVAGRETTVPAINLAAPPPSEGNAAGAAGANGAAAPGNNPAPQGRRRRGR
jgi:hypothetical protein